MTVPTLRDRIIEKINHLSDKQLESIWHFVENIDIHIQKVNTDNEKKELLTMFNSLCQETQALHQDHPLTDTDIQAEIDGYRSRQ